MKALRCMFSDDIWAVSMLHVELLPLLAAEGVDIGGFYANLKKSPGFDADEVKPFFRLLGEANPSVDTQAGQMAEEVDKAMHALYRRAASLALGQLKTVVEAIREGKQDKIPGKKLPEGETGFKINADDVVSIYTAIGSERLSREDFDEGDDIRGGVIKRYLTPLLKPELEKLADQGFFDDIANGYIWIGLYSDSQAIVERRLDEKMLAAKALEVEEKLRLLENTEDFIGNAELLRETVELYLRNNGIVAVKDTDRILALLNRFLYSGEEKPEETARDLINSYDYLDVPKWTLEYIKFFHANFDYEWSRQRLEYLVENYNYQPAREKLREWGFAGPASLAGKGGEAGEDARDGGKIDYEEEYGYGGAAN